MATAYVVLLDLWHQTNRTWAATNLGSHLAAAWLQYAQDAMGEASMMNWQHTSSLFESIKCVTGMIVHRTMAEFAIKNRFAPRTVECQSDGPQAAISYTKQLNAIIDHIRNCQTWSTQVHEWIMRNEWLRNVTLVSPGSRTARRYEKETNPN